jgi:hypothetical protein
MLLVPTQKLPLPAVVVKVIGPDERALVTVMPALSETLKLANVTAGDDKLVSAPVFVIVACPVVFSDKLGVAVLTVKFPPPMEVRLVDVLPFIEPVVVVIAPEPFVDSVTEAPLIVSAPTAI